jgi:oligopeptide transport system substrate-binding protein
MPYDPVAAKAILAESGFPDGKNFPKLEIIFNSDEAHRKIAIAIQEMWKKALNISVTLSNLDWKVYLDKESNMDYQISRAAWIGDYLDPTTFLDMFITGGGNNRTGWSNPRYDAIYTYTQVRLISPSVKGWHYNILDQHTFKYVYLDNSP